MPIAKHSIRYYELLWSFAARDFHGRYRGTILGILWSVVNPLVLFSLYVLVFGFFLKVRMPGGTSVWDFILYFGAGYFPWFFFNTAIVRAASSIIENRIYIKKIVFPSEIFPFAVVLSEAISLLISVSILLTASIFLYGISFLLFLLPIVIALELVFALACALFVSAITVYFRDLPQMLSSFFLVWFWLTPIVYTVDGVPEKLKFLAYINPMYHLIDFYRSLLLYHTFPNIKFLLGFTVFLGALLILGLVVFRRSKTFFNEML